MKNQLVLTCRALTVFVLALLFTVNASAQDAKPAASPADSVSGKIGSANVSISYSSPSVKGRKIWGELVPYNQVWRAGANAATTFTTDKAVKVEGKELPAGTYALFTIPTESSWTIIFNKTAKQWGAYKYDQTQDALRVTVQPKKSASSAERLKYVLNKKGFELHWENLVVPVSVK